MKTEVVFIVTSENGLSSNDRFQLRDYAQETVANCIDHDTGLTNVRMVLRKPKRRGQVIRQREELIAAVARMEERERIIALLAKTEFTSLKHMPHEAATIIRG